jgi:hypothetical protein
MAILNNSNAISTSGYDINNSLRFRASASAYLNRTPASAGSRTTWTLSMWVKRGALGSPTKELFTASSGGEFFFGTGDTLSLYDNSTTYLNTTQVFRDPSAWYHIILAWDTTQATNTNRIKMYVNGSQVTAFSTASYPAQNTTSSFNNNTLHNIGQYFGGGSYHFDGYMTEVNFIDGQALTPSSFGETDTTTGSWKPKAYTGTYGTNGFYLNFSDIAQTVSSNVGLGKDFSGNTNYWVTNNIYTASSTNINYDAMTDSPTLTSATVANYATWNPLINGDSATSGNLNVTNDTARGTQELLKYDAYWEITSTGGTTTAGVVSGTGTTNTTTVADTKTYGFRLTTTGTLDYINITDGGSFTNITTGLTSQQFPYASAASATTGSFNAGQRPFAATPPSGFKSLNTFNLPDSTIVKGNTVMDATLYTGTGASLSVTNAGAFKPDFVWVKGRSGATDHALYDSVRGTTIDLVSNSTAAETTQAQGLTAFGTSGFTVGTLAKMNTSAATYVGWQWQAGQGSTSSNTSGTITSTVSVNATAGFSVVIYTGTGANATVGHGLGVAPKMIIVKNRDAADAWQVYHAANTANPETDYLVLNTTAATADAADRWNDTLPTSTVFSIGNGVEVNTNTEKYVAYCWAEIAGFSKFGSYTGNGSTDGPFVYTGFRPKFIIMKNSSAVFSWYNFDTARLGYNDRNDQLYPNLSNAEDSSSGNQTIDILSNGFKIRNSTSNNNGNGNTIIYAAFAENPFKNSNAR